MLWRSSPHNASPTLCDMILPARQSGVTEARLKRIVHVELSVRSSGDVKYDGWIISNVPPAAETLELVYNRGQLHVHRHTLISHIVAELHLYCLLVSNQGPPTPTGTQTGVLVKENAGLGAFLSSPLAVF